MVIVLCWFFLVYHEVQIPIEIGPFQTEKQCQTAHYQTYGTKNYCYSKPVWMDESAAKLWQPQPE